MYVSTHLSSVLEDKVLAADADINDTDIADGNERHTDPDSCRYQVPEEVDGTVAFVSIACV